jgi:hypothetical protein
MPKTNTKIDLSDPKEGELFFLGISSSTGIAVLCSQLNRYLQLKLSFYTSMMAMNQETILDKLPIFTSFEPKENQLETDSIIEDDFFDMSIPNRAEISKYLVIQCKGEQAALFPKIGQLDYLLISNYSLTQSIAAIQSIPEVTITFPLQSMHIGKRFGYFRKLFYTN